MVRVPKTFGGSKHRWSSEQRSENKAISRPRAAGENGAILEFKETSENAGRDLVPESEDGPIRSHAPVKANCLRVSGDEPVGYH